MNVDAQEHRQNIQKQRGLGKANQSFANQDSGSQDTQNKRVSQRPKKPTNIEDLGYEEKGAKRQKVTTNWKEV